MVDIEEKQPEHYVYADYYTAVPMIQTNFYQMLQYFEKCQYATIINMQNLEFFKLRAILQAKISLLKSLLENYNSVKNSKETINYLETQYKLDKVFEILDEAETGKKCIKWEALKICKDALVKAHYALGLSAIEKQKESWEDEIAQDYA